VTAKGRISVQIKSMLHKNQKLETKSKPIDDELKNTV